MLNIPIVAIIDSNSNPEDINYPIPGNDDATRAINTFCELISNSVQSGMNSYLQSNVESDDLGSSETMSEDAAKLDVFEAKLENSVNQKSPHTPVSSTKEKKEEEKNELNLGED